ncbi:hypothetical protein OROMI_029689 [Orobanche minor]
MTIATCDPQEMKYLTFFQSHHFSFPSPPPLLLMMNGEIESSVHKSGGGEGKEKWWDWKNVKDFISWGPQVAMVITGTAVLVLYPKRITKNMERVSESTESLMKTTESLVKTTESLVKTSEESVKKEGGFPIKIKWS